jgi:dihydrofolate reductase
MVNISIIAAVAKNGVIGNEGDIPWSLPSDFAYFKKTTIGKPIIMGRKTFISIGRPLPKRVNIIVSAKKDYQPDGVIVINSLEAAIEMAKNIAQADKQNEIMIIGGASIYEQAMAKANRLYISHVELSPKGDSFFPKIDKNIWRAIEEPFVEKSKNDSASYKVIIYHKI